MPIGADESALALLPQAGLSPSLIADSLEAISSPAQEGPGVGVLPWQPRRQQTIVDS